MASHTKTKKILKLNKHMDMRGDEEDFLLIQPVEVQIVLIVSVGHPIVINAEAEVVVRNPPRIALTIVI